ncbi:MAG: lantibiotic dehydratase [Bacteroidia bacterium]
MNAPFIIHDQTLVRTPLFPFSLPENEEALLSFFKEPITQEALYLASPNLLREFQKWADGELPQGKDYDRLIIALTKYYLRMHSRCTPFGLFAGIGMAKWKQDIIDQDSPTPLVSARHTRLDMGFMCRLADKFQALPIMQKVMRYFPNSSIYQIQDIIRYVEYIYHGSSKSYQLAALTTTDAISEILALAKEGKTILELADILTDEEISIEDASEFIQALIDFQLLVSELDFSVTGEEYVLRLLQKAEIVFAQSKDEALGSFIDCLRQIMLDLAELEKKPQNSVADYRAIIDKAGEFGLDIAEQRFFQVDLNRDYGQLELGYKIKSSLKNAVKVCARMSRNVAHYRLKKFKENFTRRYEDQEVSLLEVLDVECGVGYGEMLLRDDNELTRDLFFSPGVGKDEISWHAISRWKTEKLIELSRTGAEEYVLKDEDINQFEFDEANLPPSFSLFYRLVGKGDILLENVGGSSATNLLGRFCHSNAEVKKLVEEIANEEASRNSNVIIAEIAHLPENRVGNILLRPSIREYEIPFLASSPLDKEHQIAVDDLYVSVVWDTIYLRSKRLGKIIQPRLSTAHNYSFNSQPVYQFLCDLQQQGLKTHMNFNWGPLLRHFKYLPRVRYKNLILFRAFWQLPKADFQAFVKSSGKQMMIAFADFREAQRLPERFVLSDMDNELLVDASNELSVRCFQATIKKQRQIVLKEFLYDEEARIKTPNGDAYIANQLVSTVIKNEATYNRDLPVHLTVDKPVPERFSKHSIGESWAYFRIYCGTKTMDRILLEVITPLVKQFQQVGSLDRWFFIRYRDKDDHLRVRFRSDNPEQLRLIEAGLAERLAPFERSGLAWKVEKGTYFPEVNRYGRNNIERSEKMFSLEADFMLGFIGQLSQYENTILRHLYGAKFIDLLLSRFGFKIEEKQHLLNLLQGGFEKEFNAKSSRKQISKKYHKHYPLLEELLQGTNPLYEPLDLLLDDYLEALKPYCDEIASMNQDLSLETDFEGLIATYIHMFLNRLLPSYQRKNEFVLYHFMHNYYRSHSAKNKVIQSIASTQ